MHCKKEACGQSQTAICSPNKSTAVTGMYRSAIQRARRFRKCRKEHSEKPSSPRSHCSSVISAFPCGSSTLFPLTYTTGCTSISICGAPDTGTKWAPMLSFRLAARNDVTELPSETQSMRSLSLAGRTTGEIAISYHSHVAAITNGTLGVNSRD